MAQAAFFDMQQIVEAGGDGTVRIGPVPSVSSLLFPLLPQTPPVPFPACVLNFTIRPTMRSSGRCCAARLISASGRSTAHCPQNCWSIRCATILRGGAAPRRSAGRAGASAVETAGGAGHCRLLEGQYSAAGGGISGEPSPDADHPLPWTISKPCMARCARA